MTSPSLTVNQAELAAALKVSPKTVQQWDRDGLAEAARIGMDGREVRYDAVAAFWWYHERELARAVAAVDTSAMDQAKLRKMEAEAGSKELDLAEKRGELVPLDDVGDLVKESLMAVDSVLRHAPSRFAPALAKSANIPLKSARTMLREIVEMVRGAIRDGAVGDDEAADAG